MKNTILAILFAVAIASLSGSPALGHHSMSMYDLEHVVTIRGTITDFAWSNPHAEVHFDVTDDKGTVEKWTAECPSPGKLSRVGWTMDTLKAGDQVTVTGNQAKDGSNMMRLNRVALANGQEFSGYSR